MLNNDRLQVAYIHMDLQTHVYIYNILVVIIRPSVCPCPAQLIIVAKVTSHTEDG